MTNELYTIGNYKVNRSTYGGKIYKGDFGAYHSISDIASRIIQDKKFDEQCKKNAEYRDYKKGCQVNE